MARSVFYEIRSQRDGSLSAHVTMEPDRTYSREGFESFAEVMTWIDGLRVLMDACGAPLLPLDTPGDVTMNDTTKPKLPGKKAEPTLPTKLPSGRGTDREEMLEVVKLPSKLGAEKL